MLNSLFRAALIASYAFNSAVALSPVTIKGSKFFTGGQQFFLKGVAYQGTPDDPLIDGTQCTTDAALMKTIGTNSLRVYHIDPFKNHDACMKAFADAGIYVWLHLDTFNTSIVSNAPTWTKTQFLAFTEVLDVMQQYENLGGFWIGNEVVATSAQSNASPFIKAAASDIKSYITLKNYRTIPVGYSAADVAELRPMLQNYLACETDPKNNIDFFGLNSYEWCGDSSFKTSGYSNLQDMSKGYSIPIFFSETGCNAPAPRLFTDQAAIFGSEMNDTWSGSIVYEWVQEVNNYGLVNYTNTKATGTPTAIQPGFSNLAEQWKKATPAGIAESAYTPSLSAPACPSATGGWIVQGTVAIPTLDKAIISAAASSNVGATASPNNGTAKTTSSGTAPTTTISASAVTSKVTSVPTGILTATSPAGGIFAPTSSLGRGTNATGTVLASQSQVKASASAVVSQGAGAVVSSSNAVQGGGVVFALVVGIFGLLV